MPINSTYQDTLSEVDTIYGISNDVTIPVRTMELKPVQIEEEIKIFFEPKPHPTDIANWQILILLISIVLMGFVKAFSNNRFKQGVKSLFNYSVAQEITREEKVFFHRSNIFFTIVHLLTTALFVFQLKDLFSSSLINFNTFSVFLLVLSFITGMYLFKYLFSKVLLFVFNDVTIAPEYIFNVSLYNNLLGAFLAPILCTIYFTGLSTFTVLYFIAIPILVIIFFFRLIRLFRIGHLKGVSYFYIIVYICTLEILPLVVLLRIFIL